MRTKLLTFFGPDRHFVGCLYPAISNGATQRLDTGS